MSTGGIRLYNTKEIAVILHLGVERVRQFIRLGHLRAFVHRGRCNIRQYYVKEPDLEHFLSNYFLQEYKGKVKDKS